MNVNGKLTQRIGLAAATFLLASIGTYEGRRLHVYNDIAGVPTVCDGITGKGVVPGKTYTDAECDKLVADRLDAMAAEIMPCVHVPLSTHEKVAWIHFAYNVGSDAFCNSTIVRLINSGHGAEACEQINTRWVWVAGRDCRLDANKHFCGGLITRRNQERAICDGTLPIPGVDE